MSRVNVAVYGTLKSYHPNSSLLGLDAKVLAQGVRIPNAKMYNLGWFPGVVHDSEGESVEVEVVEIDETQLRRLDAYEGVDSGLYTREEVELPEGGKAFMYFYARGLNSYPPVPNGRWEES